MAAFNFSLEPLLEYRTNLAEAKQRALLAAERALALERAGLLSLEAELRRLSGALRDERQQRYPAKVRQTLLEVDLVNAALARQQRIAAEMEEAVASARAEFASARTECERLQALRDRKYETFLAEVERREAAEDDEANAKRGTILP